MVGFMQNQPIEGAKAEEVENIFTDQYSSDLKKTNYLFLPELDEFSSSFFESYLDFESLNGWFMEWCGPNMTDLGGNPLDVELLRGELRDIGKEFEVFGDAFGGKDETLEGLNGKADPFWGLGLEDGENSAVDKCIEEGSERMNVEGVVGSERKLGDLGSLIEEQLGKVSLDGAANVSAPITLVNCESNGEVSVDDCSDSVKLAVAICDNTGGSDEVVVNKRDSKVEKNVEKSGSDEESEEEGPLSSSSSSSSSSLSSSNDDEDKGEKKGKKEEGSGKEESEVEDGEIFLSELEVMVGWSDAADEDGGGGGEPIKSKNELKDLPPVPSVNVTLEPHHETLPVGTILSIIGSQVVVEGVEKHNPLTEGSILWISESRSPLGIIDEIFGPVKNPFYIVRYNSESEVPSIIQQGSSISFVAEFADHVLNEKNLYQKGYDASNENDEELSEDAEFSDDEKEAEYRRMMKMKKRGTNDSKLANKQKEKRQQKNQKGNWNNNSNTTAQKLSVIAEEQHFVPHVGTSLNQENHMGLLGCPRQGFDGGQAPLPPFPHRPQAPTFTAPNGNWNNGFPQYQQQNMNLLSGLPPNAMLWMQQTLPYRYPIPLQNGKAFQQQIEMVPGMPPSFNSMPGQPNFGGMIPSWPMNQNAMNLPQFGMQVQHVPLPINADGEQAVQSHGSQDSHGLQQPPPAFKFNGGGLGCGGGLHRGRGRFNGGRGRRT